MYVVSREHAGCYFCVFRRCHFFSTLIREDANRSTQNFRPDVILYKRLDPGGGIVFRQLTISTLECKFKVLCTVLPEVVRPDHPWNVLYQMNFNLIGRTPTDTAPGQRSLTLHSQAFAISDAHTHLIVDPLPKWFIY